MLMARLPTFVSTRSAWLCNRKYRGTNPKVQLRLGREVGVNYSLLTRSLMAGRRIASLSVGIIRVPFLQF